MKQNVLIVALLLFLGYQHREDIKNYIPEMPSFNRVETVKVDAPSAELQKIVAPVKDILAKADKADKVFVSDFFNDFADIILKANVITTNKALKQAYDDAGALAWEKGKLSSKYKGLPEATDKAIADYLGLTAGACDKVKTHDLFKALAWSAQ